VQTQLEGGSWDFFQTPQAVSKVFFFCKSSSKKYLLPHYYTNAFYYCLPLLLLANVFSALSKHLFVSVIFSTAVFKL
jgi:hypothetical protein